MGMSRLIVEILSVLSMAYKLNGTFIYRLLYIVSPYAIVQLLKTRGSHQ